MPTSLRPDRVLPNTRPASNNILASLDRETLACLEPHLEKVSLAAGHQLFSPFGRSPFVYFPLTAVISHLVISDSALTIEVAMIGDEGLSGPCVVEEPECTPYAAVVAVAGEALRIRASVFDKEIRNSRSLAALLLGYYQRQISVMGQRMVCAAFHPTEHRLPTWLMMLSDRVRGSDLRLTHEEIAAHLGACRTTVSIAARDLRNAKLIDYMRGRVRISDPRALAGSACECWHMLKDRYSPLSNVVRNT